MALARNCTFEFVTVFRRALEEEIATSPRPACAPPTNKPIDNKQEYSMRLIGSRLAVVSAVVLFVQFHGTPAHGQSRQAPEGTGRVLRLLEGSGYQYTKLTDSAWSVSFFGKNRDTVDVIVVGDQDDVLVLSVIADRAQFDNNPAALRQLLKTNAVLPERVSVMLDDEGDYVVQTRNRLDRLTSATLKAAIAAVASASDDAYGAVF
jgi:hypothetical protein